MAKLRERSNLTTREAAAASNTSKGQSRRGHVGQCVACSNLNARADTLNAFGQASTVT